MQHRKHYVPNLIYYIWYRIFLYCLLCFCHFYW